MTNTVNLGRLWHEPYFSWWFNKFVKHRVCARKFCKYLLDYICVSCAGSHMHSQM